MLVSITEITGERHFTATVLTTQFLQCIYSYVRPMDMKLISAAGHRLILCPYIMSTVHSKSHP